jgi:hypothetical protein
MMGLSAKQNGVRNGMLGGALLSVAMIAVGILVNPFDYTDTMALAPKFSVAIQSCALIIVFLVASVGRMAGQRFFTPADIDGSLADHGTQRAKVLQSMLQNTLEQCLIATFVYLGWAAVMPGGWLSVVPLAAVTFSMGRVLFFYGYERGAQARALGFAMTFYSSAAMMICIGVMVLKNWAT